jgi:hypothetical protein
MASRVLSKAAAAGLLSLALALAGVTAQADVGTPEDRAALLEYLIEKTMLREAFSPFKIEQFDMDVEAEMRALQDEIVGAQTDEELFYALVRLSNVRRDRHLRVSPVEGGLEGPAGYETHANSNYPHMSRGSDDTVPTAPVRFQADFGGESHFVFVRDHAKDLTGKLQVGDRVAALNGVPTPEYMERIRPYFRHSSEAGFWVRATEALNEKTPILPPSLYEPALSVDLINADGEPYSLELPYLPSKTIDWAGHGDRRFEGYAHVLKTPTFDLYRHEGERKVVLFVWHGFSSSLHEDMDQAMAWAEAEQVLDHDVIFDGTVTRGGGRGVYAIQRLSPQPFKLTFGNLRISDITKRFAEDMITAIEERQADSGGNTREWLREWLSDDVMKGVETGQAYTNNVPFKLAYLPKWSDGIVQPAPVHFTGRMVCLLGPYGGSHLDQFAATVVDNDLCHTIGMPTGGYSNTWEWEEVLTFPISGKPVVEYMWNIGDTIRATGEILEGNPAQVKELVPPTANNSNHYNELLLQRAYAWLDRR